MEAFKIDTGVLSVPLVRELRPDGGLRVTSPELPGLLLSNTNHQALLDGLASAISWTARSKVPGRITNVAIYPDHADIQYLAA